MIKCPHCGSVDSTVSYTYNKQDYVLRHRRCRGCGADYHTHEVLAINAGKSRGFILDLPLQQGGTE